MTRLVSRIYAMADTPPPTGQEAERRNAAARAEVWHRLGLIVIDPAEVDDDFQRLLITRFAEENYGRRGKV